MEVEKARVKDAIRSTSASIYGVAPAAECEDGNEPNHDSKFASPCGSMEAVKHYPCLKVLPSIRDSTRDADQPSLKHKVAPRSSDSSPSLPEIISVCELGKKSSDSLTSCTSNETHHDRQHKEPRRSRNYRHLKRYLKKKNFDSAINLVTRETSKLQLDNTIKQSVEDLIYILTKYHYLNELFKGNLTFASCILENSIKPRIQEEVNGLCKDRLLTGRAEWFAKDFQMLHEVLRGTNLSNTYCKFDLEKDIKLFWKAGEEYLAQIHDTANTRNFPLYTRALALHFMPEVAEGKSSESYNLDIASKSTRAVLSKPLAGFVTTKEAVSSPMKAEEISHADAEQVVFIPKQIRSKKSIRGSATGSRSDIEAKSSSLSLKNPEIEACCLLTKKLMPPIPKFQETSNFALSTFCGPLSVHIRALDVSSLENGESVVAVAGGQDRSDRRITIWNIKTGYLVQRLENNTHKPIVCLQFHPTKVGLLLSCDMEHDVKLWDWKLGEQVRSWKKMHTRIIYQCVFISSTTETNYSRIASCSADQTLKMWDMEAGPSPRVSSVHANEPFTSFLICGSKSNDYGSQTLVASLSYCLRIYKLRTLALVHIVHLKDLKLK